MESVFSETLPVISGPTNLPGWVYSSRFQPANEFNWLFAASLLLGVGLRDNGKDTGAIYKACGVIRHRLDNDTDVLKWQLHSFVRAAADEIWWGPAPERYPFICHGSHADRSCILCSARAGPVIERNQ